MKKDKNGIWWSADNGQNENLEKNWTKSINEWNWMNCEEVQRENNSLKERKWGISEKSGLTGSLTITKKKGKLYKGKELRRENEWVLSELLKMKVKREKYEWIWWYW